MTYHDLWQRLVARYDEGEAKAIVRWLLEEQYKLSPIDIYSGGVEALSLSSQARLDKAMLRLEKGEPVQYVLGVAEFYGYRLHVEPGVLIPRPETEELCHWLIKSEDTDSAKSESPCNVLDIGTGSGCIAITLALKMAGSKVYAWDISDEALRIAHQNATTLNADVIFRKLDALNISTTTIQKWDVIVSNPPYIDEVVECNAMDANVLDYEPRIALFAPEQEPDLFYRRIGDYAWQSLTSGGRLYFELNPLTAGTVSDYLRDLGFQKIEVRHDQFGKLRFLKAKKI